MYSSSQESRVVLPKRPVLGYWGACICVSVIEEGLNQRLSKNGKRAKLSAKRLAGGISYKGELLIASDNRCSLKNAIQHGAFPVGIPKTQGSTFDLYDCKRDE